MQALIQKTHHQTPMTYGYSHFIHFKTVATEVELQFFKYIYLFVATVWKCLFSSKEEGVSTFVHIMNVQVIGVW